MDTWNPGLERQAGRGNSAPPKRSGLETATSPTIPRVSLVHMTSHLLTAVAFPFRMLSRAFDVLGRMASLALGFLLMVGGAAFVASPMFWFGVPVFLFGVYLTLRSLG